jgi:hypothetical protein
MLYEFWGFFKRNIYTISNPGCDIVLAMKTKLAHYLSCSSLITSSTKTELIKLT